MLTGIGGVSENGVTASDISEQISDGVASEVRSELEETDAESGAERMERLESALEDLRETLASQLRRRPIRDSDDSAIVLSDIVRQLPIESRAMLQILARGGHLTRKQYLSSTKNQYLRIPIKRLRAGGLLVPLVGTSESGRTEPVYYFPPHTIRSIKLASQLVGDIPKDIVDNVSAALKNVGYSPWNSGGSFES
jgi:hypothetical protein